MKYKFRGINRGYIRNKKLKIDKGKNNYIL